MKKIIPFVFSLFIVLLASCNNLHFDSGTSLSIYLPELNQQKNDSRSLSFPDGYDDSVYYYDIALKQNNQTRYQTSSAGGTTLTITNITGGDYIVECNACVKKGLQKTIFASVQKPITIINGQNATVDLDLHKAPFIVTQPAPAVFTKTDGQITVEILQSSVPEKPSQDDSFTYFWYLDGTKIDLDNPELSDYLGQYSFKINTEGFSGTGSSYITFTLKTGKGGDDYLESIIGRHSVYLEITNAVSGASVRTDAVDLYILNIESLNDLQVTDFTADFNGDKTKGVLNTYTITPADFSGRVVYEYNTESGTVNFQ